MLLLPFIDGARLYDQYDFSESWDGPHNGLLAGNMPNVFRCWSDKTNPGLLTNYVAVVGPETAWPGAASTRISDFSAGTDHTIHVVESANAGIPWMEPRDLTFEQAVSGINQSSGPGISSFHDLESGLLNRRKGANVSFVDGRVEFLPADLDVRTLKSLLTARGAETVPDHPIDADRLDLSRVTTLAVLGLVLAIYFGWVGLNLRRASRCVAP